MRKPLGCVKKTESDSAQVGVLLQEGYPEAGQKAPQGDITRIYSLEFRVSAHSQMHKRSTSAVYQTGHIKTQRLLN